MRNYRYELGIEVNGTPIPDPSEINGQTADVDTSAERDTTGYLHRNRVGTKVTMEMKWKVLDWAMVQTILTAVSPDAFQLTFPDPNTGAHRTGTFYAGNRKWPAVWMPAWKSVYGEGWYADLSFSLIEY